MLKLQPNPTFRAKVAIPVPGEDSGADVVCIFKHMTKAQYEAFTGDAAIGRSDVDTLLALLAGWEGIDADFSPDAVAALVQNYSGAPFAIASAYAAELTKARAKN